MKVQALEHELKQAKELVDILEKKQEQWTARSALLLSKHNVSNTLPDRKNKIDKVIPSLTFFFLPFIILFSLKK